MNDISRDRIALEAMKCIMNTIKRRRTLWNRTVTLFYPEKEKSVINYPLYSKIAQESYLIADEMLKNRQQTGYNKENQETDKALSPIARIQQMLVNYGDTRIDLDEYYKTGNGYIATVYTHFVEYAHGDTEEYENLEYDILEALVYEVENQIVSNEKAFKRCQD